MHECSIEMGFIPFLPLADKNEILFCLSGRKMSRIHCTVQCALLYQCGITGGWAPGFLDPSVVSVVQFIGHELSGCLKILVLFIQNF